MKKTVKKTPAKKVVAKKTAKKVTKKAAAKTSKVTMTLKQAQTIQKALGNKSYKFLDTKVADAIGNTIIL